MKIAICDDEKFFRNELITNLNKYAKQHHTDIICDEYSDGRELIASKNNYDIIFMDYQMKNINGLDTAKKLRNNSNNTDIIFLTSYPHIVFDVFSVNAFRFLVKPLDYEKLSEALNDFKKFRESDNYITIKTDDIVKKIHVKDIIYAEACDKYCYIRTTDENYLYKKTLSELEKILSPEHFFRSHRAFLVNMQHIISHTNTDIIFENNERALISKMKLSGFKSTFLNYVKNKTFK